MSIAKDVVSFTVLGEPASKANSRRHVTNRRTGKPMFIKSEKALKYEQDFAWQCPKLAPLLEGDLSVTITVHYASRRPDLDESVILDCMQGKIYENDRQVREKHIFWALDRDNPRADIQVTTT